MFSGFASIVLSSGIEKLISSPIETLNDFGTGLPLTLTSPSSIICWICERVKSEHRSDSVLSILSPAKSESIRKKKSLMLLTRLFAVPEHINDNVNHNCNRTDSYKNIGKIENCEIHKLHVDEINNISPENSVNQIAEAA